MGQSGRKSFEYVADAVIQVAEVEDIPQNVEYGYDRAKYRMEDRFDNAVDDVEDAPDRVAEWSGEEVGRVERFDDRIEESYDEGIDEGRNDW
jgi:hypothetical protein